MYARSTIKPLTFDGQTSWTVFKTQFDVVSSTNGWTDFVKASQLVALLRGSAAEVLQGIPADKLTDLTTIEKALESRFGDSHLMQFYKTELKTRRQKPGESLQVLAADGNAEAVHDLRSFLGLSTYYRRFVKNFSTIARPLHKLTEAKSNFNWTEECEKPFNSLKQVLTSSPILTYPRTDKDFILDTDASNEGIGAVLSQNMGNEEHVIAYFSKSLGKPERNYCVTRKELLAIVKSIEHFHHYLYGQKFLLRTDHASLRWLLNFKEPEGQIARWIQRLQEYDFEIQHRKGTCHGNADALSRRPCKESCKQCTNAEKKFGMERDISVKVLTTTTVDPWSSCDIQKAQLEDPAIKLILEKKLNLAD
ncbi:Retrovirus-related Pol polyprotein from transposon 297 [Araneus ventricosus]|uniref:RNA-directed DNA polymerase n=1 Tax=Araneus ventricosus TaxID=182803 RepID=A0A4Y2HB71_ARAVE|nr:Retrovirus-related Pol polyprotein from transposon 297 [Araneus ventricosus]